MIGEGGLKPRDNPFRASRLESLKFRFSTGSFDELRQKVKQTGFRGALIGPKGSGKTTLLEELTATLGKAGRPVLILRRRPDEQPLPRLGPLDPNTFIALDGAEQLGLIERLRFCREIRGVGGLLATAHRPLSWLPTANLHRTSSEQLAELVDELLERDGYQNPWTRDDLSRLFDQQEGNLRECFRKLYDEAPKRLDASQLNPRRR